jgi:plastocyanin
MRGAGSLLVVALLGVLAAFALPHTGGAANPQLTAMVSNPANISLVDAQGNPVTSLAPGTYDIVVTDSTALHNFHLTGSGGVDQMTGIATTSSTTWTVTFTAGGKYHFQCDAHPTTMFGNFSITGGTTSSPSTTMTTSTTSTTQTTATIPTTGTTLTGPTTTGATTIGSTTAGSTTTIGGGGTTTRSVARKAPVKKVTICHKGRTIKIKKSQLRRHLKHGDKRGHCRKPKKKKR